LILFLNIIIPILNKTTMRTIKKKASIIELENTPKFGWLNINFGEEVFHLLKGGGNARQNPL